MNEEESKIRNEIAVLKQQIEFLEKRLDWIWAGKPKPEPVAYTGGDLKIKVRFRG